VLLKVNRPDIPSHIIHTQLNLLSARSKKQLIDEAEDRYPLPQGRWTNIVEQLCEGSLENYRRGKPAREIWPAEGEEAPEAPFLIKPLIYKDKPTIIFGEGSTGKSYLAVTLGILVQLPYPDNPLGLLPQRANVLYLDYESDEAEFRKRLTLLGNGLGVSPVPVLYRECELPLVDDIDHLEQVVAEHQIGFIIIDSLGVAAGNANLNDAPTATAFYSALRRLKVTSLIITHTSKEERSKATPFGSVYFTNLARSVFEVRRQQEEGSKEIAVALVHRKNNQGPLLSPQGFRIVFQPDRTMVKRMDVESVPEFLEKLSLKARIIHLLKDEGKLSTSDIAQMLDISESAARVTLNRHRDTFVRVGKEWGLLAREP
jgi:DNA-directed RNA polymerase specialized sigma24 family protein